MANKNNKTKSVRVRFLAPMFIIVFIVSALFAGVFLFGGTISSLNGNSFDILNERVINRKNIMQSDMLNRWSAIDEAYLEVSATINRYFTENKLKTARQLGGEDSEALLSGITRELISLMRNNEVTDAFMILRGASDNYDKQGVYLRDLDPASRGEDNSDILIEASPPSVSKNLGLPLDSMWTPVMNLVPDDNNSDFFYRPIEAANKYSGVGYLDLGYWSRPFSLKQGSRQAIAYSVPLITADGEVMGVMGVGLTVDYLASVMPYTEINADKHGSFMLSVSSENEDDMEVVAYSGPQLKVLLGSNDSIAKEKTEVYSGISLLQKNDRVKEDIYMSVQQIKLYNSNTPFEEDQWLLSGIISGEYLLAASQQIRYMVIISSLIALALGMLISVVFSTKLTKPITALAKEMREADPGKVVVFKKTNITEIDELARAVTALNKDVEEAASKLSRIIQMANIPIAAFEHIESTDSVLITGGLFTMFGFENEPENSYYMPIEEFQARFSQIGTIEGGLDKWDTHVFRMEGEKNTRWVRLKVMTSDNRYVGVATDITQEMLEKRKLEYERDYDLLTNLLNRRAFHAAMYSLIKMPGKLKTGAFMMWDLDNLKYINDTYGHDCGDEYIQKAAQILKKFMPYNDAVVSRVSGDEFYVFLYGYDTKGELLDIIDEVRQKMADSALLLPDGQQTKIRASAGIAWYPDDSENYHELIKYADFAMYTVKHTEKGEVAQFDKGLYNKDSFMLHSKEELNRLIDDKLINYAFQPIVDAHTGDIFAYEALMRPTSETLKSPLDVLRLAKAQSKLYQIERISMFESVNTFLRFEDIVNGKKLFINTLPGYMMTEADHDNFERRFKSFLDRLVFEFTELEQLTEKNTKQKLDLINKWGAQSALDDYGTGYNSETILLWFTPSYVKLDMSLVRNVDVDESRQLLISNLLGFLKRKGIKTIGEGVETGAEMKMLINLGVDYLQGYYLGKPYFTPMAATGRRDEILWVNSNIKPGETGLNEC